MIIRQINYFGCSIYLGLVNHVQCCLQMVGIVRISPDIADNPRTVPCIDIVAIHVYVYSFRYKLYIILFFLIEAIYMYFLQI